MRSHVLSAIAIVLRAARCFGKRPGSEGRERTDRTARALEACERTLNLLRQSSEVELGDWMTDITGRIDRLRGAAETK